MSDSFISDISEEYLKRTAELLAAGKSDQTVANELGIRRHQARKLIEKVKLEQARKEQRGELVVAEWEPVTADEFAAAILGCWRKSVAAIFETGRMILRAKDVLPHGAFLDMIEAKLPFSANMAQKLMRIARHEWLSNIAIWQHLPANWTTLYQLSTLEPSDLDKALEAGSISPEMTGQSLALIRVSEPPLDGEIIPPDRITNPAVNAPPPDGEGPHTRLEGSERIAVPPLQDSGIREQESVAEPAHHVGESHPVVSPEGRRSDGDSGSDQAKQEGTADDRDSRGRHGPHSLSDVTPPRPALSEPGGAEESKSESKPAWNASRITPRDDPDFFPTGPWITRTLFERVLPQVGIRRIQTAWEPACGEGHMAEVIREYAAAVYASDIRDYGYSGAEVLDFLTLEPTGPSTDWIITNPPYSGRALEFALRALDVAGEGVALFTSIQFIAEGKERYERLLRDRPPTLIAFFVERAPIHQGRWEPNGDTKQAYCWIVWRKNHRPKAPFWIPPGCRESLTHPDDAERFTAHPVIRKEHQFPPLDMGHNPEAAVSDRNAGPGQPAASPIRSVEMPDMPDFLDRRKEQTESN